MTKSINNAQYTDYENLFRNTYWGQYTAEPPASNIIENRNRFVNEFSVKTKVNSAPKYVKNHYWDGPGLRNSKTDHIEVYKTKENRYLIINSPSIPENNIRDLENDDWILTDNLYSNSTTSFYKLL